MKITLVGLAAVFICAAGAMAAEDREIRITAPVGDPLECHVRSEILQVRWTHGAYFNGHPENCCVLCGGHVLSPYLPVTADAFTWTVGRKNDGTYMEPGDYPLSIQTTAGDGDLNGPWFRYATSAPAMTFTAPAEEELILLGSLYTIR
jgi:hypothetical protein